MSLRYPETARRRQVIQVLQKILKSDKNQLVD